MSWKIREATLRDAAELLAIYTPYVTETAITFENDVPTVEEFTQRMQAVQEKYPYLVLEEDGRILGYAYASTFKGRAAYDWSVETSIYVRKDAHRGGWGRKLYEALEEALKKQGVLNMYACIGVPRGDDPYLTNNSMDFHAHLGYRLVGRFECCGCKYGRWYEMVWMELMLGEHAPEPTEVKAYRDVI